MLIGPSSLVIVAEARPFFPLRAATGGWLVLPPLAVSAPPLRDAVPRSFSLGNPAFGFEADIRRRLACSAGPSTESSGVYRLGGVLREGG